jgi:hypothetical protein
LIAIDTNILVHAHREDSPFHLQAAQRVIELTEGMSPSAIPWPCRHEFLSKRAVDQVDAWRQSPTVTLLTETPDHWATLRRLLVDDHVNGPKVHDARIASLCEQHGVHELWSLDRDFGRLPALSVVNPLVRA